MGKDKSAEPPSQPQHHGEHGRLSTEFNLEREPIHTDRAPDDHTLRSKAAMGLEQFYLGRRMAGWVGAVLIVVILAIAGLAFWGIWYVAKMWLFPGG